MTNDPQRISENLPNDLNAFVAGTRNEFTTGASGRLSGKSLAVKDIFDVKGLVSGWGNPQRMKNATPASATAPAVQRLIDAGATYIGKTQTDELAFSLMGRNTHFPEPINPAAPDRVTGGSSSGSAAAVAGGLADIAVGSDTGGSIRAPASFCGLVGLRTTFGAIPLEGAMQLAPSFDTFGWFARDIETYAKVGNILLDKMPIREIPPHVISLQAYDKLVLGPAERDEYQRMVTRVAKVIGMPRQEQALSLGVDQLYWCFRRLQSYEAWAIHGDWISREDRNLGPDIKDRFDFGKSLGCGVAVEETAIRNQLRNELGSLLGENGILVLPTVPGAAPRKFDAPEAQQAYREQALRLLCLAGLSGFPQITLPLGSIEGAPFGLSLLGPAGYDRTLIKIAELILSGADRVWTH